MVVRGYGEPALYDAKVELVDSDGTILSTDNKRVYSPHDSTRHYRHQPPTGSSG